MRRKGIRTKEKTVGYGYVGRWSDGTLGWALPDHLDQYTHGPTRRDWVHGRFELCKITVEVVKAKNGRAITKHKRKPTPGGAKP